MKNNTNYAMRHGGPRIAAPPSLFAVAAMLCATVGGCSHKAEQEPQASLNSVTLTAAQRQNIRVYAVVPAQYHRTIETTGVVDFDNDQATSVLAPFSGPVTRLLVSLGARVKKGDPLAAIDSADYAAAVSAYRKALATANTNRRLADADKDLVEHNGV
jgi:cobalt-zinc-cadmium efflux system membrane fusion protein